MKPPSQRVRLARAILALVVLAGVAITWWEALPAKRGPAPVAREERAAAGGDSSSRSSVSNPARRDESRATSDVSLSTRSSQATPSGGPGNGGPAASPLPLP